MSQEIVIDVQNVKKNFLTYQPKGTGFFSSLRRQKKIQHALNGISLNIKKAEIVALIGRNGSGKSTLIKIISGILYPDKGNVRILNFNPWKQRKNLSMHLGVVFGATHPQVFWNLPPIDTFEFIRDVYEMDQKDYNKNLSYLIKILSLQKVLKTPARQLSLGERMKCEFVAATLYFPDIVLMDEPTIGVDLPSRINIKRAILEMRKKHNTTFLITTHVVEDINGVDRIILLDKGKKLFDGNEKSMRKVLAKQIILEIYSDNNFNASKFIEHGKIIESKLGFAKISIMPNMLKSDWLLKLLKRKEVIDYRIEELNLSMVLNRFYKRLDKKLKLNNKDKYEE